MLKGMVALVSGGAGSLGLATVTKFLAHEMKVVIVDLPNNRGRDLEAQLGGKVLFAPTDIRSEKEVRETVNKIREKHGKLDVIVNCAGSFLARALFNLNSKNTAELSNIQNFIELNLTGTLNVIKEGVMLMTENEPDKNGLRGVVINTSGFSAHDGQKGQVVMSAVWGGISSMTLPLCRELACYGIRVVTICPGIMNSTITKIIPKKVLDHLSAVTPSPKRIGEPEEYAHLAVAVIENPYINGEVIKLDGGLRFNFV